MKYSRFRTIGRSILKHLVETLILMGPAFGLSPTVVFESSGRMRQHDADATSELDNPYTDNVGLDAWVMPTEVLFPALYIKPASPLSRAERVQWTALVERLR
jgi:hypothetical protein